MVGCPAIKHSNTFGLCASLLLLVLVSLILWGCSLPYYHWACLGRVHRLALPAAAQPPGLFALPLSQERLQLGQPKWSTQPAAVQNPLHQLCSWPCVLQTNHEWESECWWRITAGQLAIMAGFSYSLARLCVFHRFHIFTACVLWVVKFKTERFNLFFALSYTFINFLIGQVNKNDN